MDAVRNSIIVSHNKLIQELEIKYLTYITALLQQKAFIHQKIQQNLYQELFKIHNIAYKHSQTRSTTIQPKIPINRKHSEAQIFSTFEQDDCIEINNNNMEQPNTMNVDNLEKMTEKIDKKKTNPAESSKRGKITLPVWEAHDHKNEAELLKVEGNKLLKQKKYQRAIVEYTKAINLNPLNAIYYSNRAAAYTKLKHYEKAVIDSHQACIIDPTYIKAYLREAFAEYQMNHYQNAYDIYQNALSRITSDKDKEMYQKIQDDIKLCQTEIQKAKYVQKKLVNHMNINKVHTYRRDKVLNQKKHNQLLISGCELPYKCSKCNKAFKQNQCLQKHMIQHMYIASKQVICSYCSKPFESKHELLKHVENHHIVVINTKGSTLQLFDTAYSCDECNFSFQTKLQLEKHIKQHENGSNKGVEAIQAKDKDFLDDDTTISTNNSNNSNDEKNGGEMKVTYPKKCPQHGFLYKYNSKAAKGKQFICKSVTDADNGVCNRKFGQKCHLTSHCLERHSKEISHRYECSYCDKTYTQNSSLKEHIALRHSNSVLMFRCPYCSSNVTFTRWRSVLRHCGNFHTDKPAPQTRERQTLTVSNISGANNNTNIINNGTDNNYGD